MKNKKDIALINATKNKDLATIKKLIKKGANVNEIWDGKTPLIYAAKNGDEEIVEYLLANGADANYVAKDNHHVLKLDSLQKLCMLRESLSYNIWNWYNYFNIFDFPIKKGDTALILAAEYGHTKIVEKLAYTIYKQEKQKWSQFQFHNFVISVDNNFKTLQELANDVQKTITGIDLKEPNPEQRLANNLNLVNLTINNQKINKINKKINEKNQALIKEVNEIELKHQLYLTKFTNYCTIL